MHVINNSMAYISPLKLRVFLFLHIMRILQARYDYDYVYMHAKDKLLCMLTILQQQSHLL